MSETAKHRRFHKPLSKRMEHFNIDSDCDLVGSLVGKSPLVGYAIDSDYWHLELFLRFDDGALLQLTCNEHCLAPLFDCYTLTIRTVSACDKQFSTISPPFPIDRAFPLRRAEWLEAAPELDNVTVGNNAHTQHSGLPDSVPDDAVVSAVLTVGVLVHSTDGRHLAVVASESAPLNVDFLAERREVQDLLQRHEMIRGD